MASREQQRERMRSQILMSALDVFEARGFDGATVDAIARAADVSLPTLFRHYPSKVDILFADDDAILAAWEEAILEVVPGESLLDALRRATLGGSARAVDPRLAALRTRLLPESAELRRRQFEFDDHAQRRAAEAIRRRLELPEADLRPRAIAAATMAAVRAAQEQWAAQGADRMRSLESAFTALSRLEPLWRA